MLHACAQQILKKGINSFFLKQLLLVKNDLFRRRNGMMQTMMES